MSWLALLNPGLLVIFMLVLARVAGIVVTAPIYGGPEIPAQVRVLLAIMLALLVTPVQAARVVDPPQTLAELTIVMASEALLGIVLGLGVMVLLSGMQMAGQVVSQMSGMSIGEVFNPQLDASVPLFSQLFYYFALALFALLGGHRLILGALLDTFDTMPPGQAVLGDSVVEVCSTLLTQAMTLGVRVSAPATAALLLANIILGIISRTLPQLNVLSFGFGFSALITFAILWLSVGNIGHLFEEQIEPMIETLLGH
ncbi:MAG: flagellar biosynthetic protein FliR [Planctomycetaceae bacterium]|nr:flagellar biosynthetic protein FliR [Planctomycetaceae bacterium]